MRAEQEDKVRHLELEVARLRDALDCAGSVSYTCEADSAYKLTAVTKNVRDLSGYPPERFLEDSSFWPSCIHAEDQARVLRRLRAGDVDPCTQEYRYRDAGGALRWVRDTRRTLPATELAAAHVAGVWLDITAEKEWEERFARLNTDFEGHVSDRTRMVVREAGEHRRTRDALGQVITSARCQLWEAHVAYVDCELQWRANPAADESDRRVVSLDLDEDEEWYHASHLARLPEDNERMTATARDALVGGEPGYSQDFRGIDRSGSVRWLHEDVHAEPVGENAWRVVGVTTDITERKRAEFLQEAVVEIAEAVHAAPDLEDMYARIHSALAQLIDARNFYIALVDPEDPDTYAVPYCVDERHEAPPPTRSSLGKSRTAHVVRTGEALLLTRDATLAMVRAGDLELAGDPGESWLGVPLVADEVVIGVVAVLSYEDESRYTERDVEMLTFVARQIAVAIDRKRAQETLAYERGLFNALMDNMPDYVYFKDTESRFLRVNREGARRLSIEDPAHAVGKSDADFFPVDWREVIQEEERGILSGGPSTIGGLTHPTRPDGSQPWILVTKVPTFDAEGRISGIVGVNRDVTELMQAREALEQGEAERRVLLQRVMTAQEEERESLARELHDQVGQELSGILLGLRVAMAATTLDGAREQVSSLRDQMSEAIESVRQMAFDMRPGSLEELGLAVALRQELDALGRAADIQVSLTAPDGEDTELPPEVEIGLYRIVRGAFANILQHADAREVGVIMSASPGHVTVVVTDDGVGFDVDALMSAPTEDRFGILAMHERVEMLSGTVCVESAPGEGTAVFVCVPLPDPGGLGGGSEDAG